jgi:hypothetical protein
LSQPTVAPTAGLNTDREAKREAMARDIQEPSASTPSTPTPTTAPESPTLQSRYGRTPGRRRRDRWLLAGGAVAILAIVTAWAFWAGWDNNQADLQATDTAYTIADAHHVEITFTINTKPGTGVTCALQALNDDYAIVGWRIVSYPASDARVSTHTETIRTIAQSNTGLINTCWLT